MYNYSMGHAGRAARFLAVGGGALSYLAIYAALFCTKMNSGVATYMVALAMLL